MSGPILQLNGKPTMGSATLDQGQVIQAGSDVLAKLASALKKGVGLGDAAEMMNRLVNNQTQNQEAGLQPAM